MGYDFTEEAQITNKQLAGELAKIGPLSERDINQILPKKIDKENLRKLINIVNSSSTEAEKIASIRENLTELGSVIIKVTAKIFRPF